MKKVIDVAHRFGITRDIPPYLPVALGSVEVTLVQQVAAYSSFPNDGVRVDTAIPATSGDKRRRDATVGGSGGGQ